MIVIVFVAPLPDATTPVPTKFNIVASVAKDEPSSCTVILLPPTDSVGVEAYTIRTPLKILGAKREVSALVHFVVNPVVVLESISILWVANCSLLVWT